MDTFIVGNYYGKLTVTCMTTRLIQGSKAMSTLKCARAQVVRLSPILVGPFTAQHCAIIVCRRMHTANVSIAASHMPATDRELLTKCWKLANRE